MFDTKSDKIRDVDPLISLLVSGVDEITDKVATNTVKSERQEYSELQKLIIDDGVKKGIISKLRTLLQQKYERKFSKLLFVITCLSNYLCMLIGGLCLSWLEPLTSYYQGQDSEVPMTEKEVSLVVSLVEVGAFFVPIPAGILIDRVGRRMSMLLTGVVGLAGFLLAVFTRSLWALCIARVLTGLALGGSCTVAPIYLAEISPPRIRGSLAGQLTTMYFSGQLAAYACGHTLDYSTYLWACAAFPFALICLGLLCPESPTYFLKIGKPEQALEVAKKLRRTFPQVEFDAARTAIEREEAAGSDWRNLLQPGPLKILLAFTLLSFISHANGLSAISLYATETFGGREWLTLVMGGILAGSAFFAAFLTDIVGRRPLLATSLVGSAFATAILAAYFYSGELMLLYVGTVLFCIISSFGSTPLIFTLRSELFPASTRALGTAISELTLSLGSFFSLITYVPVNNTFGIGVNYISYSIFSLVGFLTVIFILPETANINIDSDNC